jgi:hypothetical protein
MNERPRGFDRIKAPQQRLLERGNNVEPEPGDSDPDGRAALFTRGASGGTGITVHCSRCDAVSPLSAATALRSAFPLFLLAPWRNHPVFAVCPSCNRRSWLRPRIEP